MGIGTSIVTRAGPSQRVLDVEKKTTPTTVYNFAVEDFHTYFVGNSKLWVHNGDCGPAQIVQHAWDDHFDMGNGGEFLNHPVHGEIQWLAERKYGNQWHPDPAKRGLKLLQEDCQQYLEDVIANYTRKESLPDGTAYYYAGDKVVIVHRHDANGNTLPGPGSIYRGTEQTFENIVNGRY